VIKISKNLIFGTAGIPLSTTESGTLGGIKRVNELGLGAMELEFVRSVNIKEEKAAQVNELAKKENIELTCHGQYYINLNSLEIEKIKASVFRIMNAANIANLCGAKSLTFHAGFYQGMEKEKTYENIKKQIKTIVQQLKQNNNPIIIRPETTGKGTQWGDIDEIIKLSQEIEQVLPCIDFSHLHARSNGAFNTKKEFDNVLEKVEKNLGKEALNNMHCHVSGIEYSEKGERNHLILEDSDMNYKDLMKSFKDFNAKGIIISESPNIEQDALLMKKVYEKIN
jgi:deoxyribonuclease IV